MCLFNISLELNLKHLLTDKGVNKNIIKTKVEIIFDYRIAG